MGDRTRRPWGKGSLIIREATTEDVVKFAPTIADEDAAEMRAIAGLDPTDGFLWAHSESDESYCAEVIGTGEIAAMWGAKNNGPAAAVWLICGPPVKACPVSFTRVVHEELRRLSDRYGVLYGFADERNHDHLHWLERVGFVFTRTHENFGPEERTFFEFAGSFKD